MKILKLLNTFPYLYNLKSQEEWSQPLNEEEIQLQVVYLILVRYLNH